MRGAFFDEAAEGDDGASAGEGSERRPATSESASGRGASPENISSDTDFDADAGLSGADAADRRAANVDKTGFARARAAGFAWATAGVCAARACVIAGCTAGTALIDGAISDDDSDGESGMLENELPILGRDGTEFGTATDGEFGVSTTRV